MAGNCAGALVDEFVLLLAGALPALVLLLELLLVAVFVTPDPFALPPLADAEGFVAV